MRSNPVVPFKLVNLPYAYEDLLLRLTFVRLSYFNFFFLFPNSINGHYVNQSPALSAYIRNFKKCCPKCGAVKEQPALRLLCGELCSGNLETCCRFVWKFTNTVFCILFHLRILMVFTVSVLFTGVPVIAFL